MTGDWIERQIEHHLVPTRDRDRRELELHVVTAGPSDGPVVVLLHGFPEFWYSWRFQIPALAAAGFRVLAPDMRGYARSSRPRGRRAYRDELLTDDVAALLDWAGVTRAHVVGHDWGGLVAWLFAARHPDRIERLAVLNMSHPRAYLHAMTRSLQLLRSWYVLAFQIPWLPERLLLAANGALLRQVLSSDRGPLDARARGALDHYVEAFRRPGALTCALAYYRTAFWRLLVSPGHWWRTPRIDAPTLVVWGQADRYLDLAGARPPQDLVPDQRVVFLPGISHWVQVQAPRQVNAALLEHFSSPPA